jgi:hypothetical protein
LRSAQINRNHPLVGTWEVETEDSSAVFTIIAVDGQFVVSGIDELDNESFRISDVLWDGEALQFTGFMPSTKHRAKLVLRMFRKNRATCELTLYEVWKKRSPRKLLNTKPIERTRKPKRKQKLG